MRQKGLTASSGDTIPYVICQQSSNSNTSSGSSSLADFAYHPDEVRKDGTLRLDVSWYLQTQLHPPIARLCEHIEGTDSSQLAACLGLDPKKFRSASSNSNGDDSLLNSTASSRFASLLSDEERFANVEKLKVSCPSCSNSFEFSGIVKESQESPLIPCMNCSSCDSAIPINSFYYATMLSLQKASNVYNSFWMKCDEVGCQLETERLGVYDRRCPADGCKGVLRPRLSHSYLYTHLLYLRSLFSTEKVASRLGSKLSPADNKLLQQLNAEVEPVMSFIDQKMKSCAYPVIDFKQIFGFLHNNNNNN